MENDGLVSIFSIPLETLHGLGSDIVNWILDHLKHIIIGGGAIVVIKVLISVLPSEFLAYLISFMIRSHNIFSALTNSLNLTTVVVMIAAFWVSVIFIWTKSFTIPFMIVNHILWAIILGYLCSFLGALQIPVFICFITYCFIGLLYSLNDVDVDGSFITKCKSLISTEKHNAQVDQVIEERPETLSTSKNENLESSQYFKILFYACFATIIWKHTWLIFIGLVSTSVYILSSVAKNCGLTNLIVEKNRQYSQRCEEFIADRRFVLFPICLPGVSKLNAQMYKFICTKCKTYVDDISSVFVILLLVFAIIFTCVFSAIQIYSGIIKFIVKKRVQRCSSMFKVGKFLLCSHSRLG